MARKDKPYLPLYVQDFMTDEKLMECSAAATGVYIRIMCVMHKSEIYGTILLKQKDKQKESKIKSFAYKLAKHLPYDLMIIESALEELISEKCLLIEGDLLKQKRMFEDGILSSKRSESGTKGGNETQKKNKKFAKAKFVANSDIDIDIDNSSIKLPIVRTNNGPVAFINSMKERFVISNPNYSASDEDFGALFDILNFIRSQEKIESAMHDLKPEEEEKIKVTWDKWIPVIIKKFLNKSLSEVSRFKKTEISNIVKNGSVTKQKDILNGNGDLKGAKFSDNFLEVIFPDGSTQKLNKDQSRQAEYGMLKANSITKGIMN